MIGDGEFGMEVNHKRHSTAWGIARNRRYRLSPLSTGYRVERTWQPTRIRAYRSHLVRAAVVNTSGGDTDEVWAHCVFVRGELR